MKCTRANNQDGRRELVDSRAGQVLLMSTVSLFFMFGVLGLAADLGLALYQKQQAQAAADAAAGGAVNYALKSGNYTCGSGGVVCNSSYNCPSPVGSVTTNLLAACAYAHSNGFTNTGSQTVSVIANNTTISGVTPKYWVQATVSQNLGNLFYFPVGVPSLVVRAQATAAIVSTAPTNASCIYALGANMTSFYDTASGNVATSQCGINVNGNFSYSGSGNINTSRINANGNFSDSGSGNITATGSILYNGTYSKTGSGSISPAATSGATAVSDPFSTLAAPTVGSCNYINYSYSSSSNATVNPGVYCGGMSISGSGNLTFNPGTYIMYGGGLNYSGSGNVSSTSIMVYNTGGGSYPIAPVKLTGSGNMNFIAPSSGTYEGILFYQDRTQTYASPNQVSGSGNVSSGSFYFPTTEIDYSGSGNSVYQALIAKVVKFTGSGNLANDTTGQLTGLVVTTSTLIQ